MVRQNNALRVSPKSVLMKLQPANLVCVTICARESLAPKKLLLANVEPLRQAEYKLQPWNDEPNITLP